MGQTFQRQRHPEGLLNRNTVGRNTNITVLTLPPTASTKGPTKILYFTPPSTVNTKKTTGHIKGYPVYTHLSSVDQITSPGNTTGSPVYTHPAMINQKSSTKQRRPTGNKNGRQDYTHPSTVRSTGHTKQPPVYAPPSTNPTRLTEETKIRLVYNPPSTVKQGMATENKQGPPARIIKPTTINKRTSSKNKKRPSVPSTVNQRELNGKGIGPLSLCKDKKLRSCPKIGLTKKQRVVIIGAGPTGLGVAHRLYGLGVLRSNTQVVVLDRAQGAGGLASSYRDQEGFLWDNGGHVVFSHYPYYDHVLDKAVTQWEKRSRAAYAFMMGSSGKRKFIPYPVQNSVHVMDEKEQIQSLRGLKDITRHPIPGKPSNFDEWLVRNFGEGLCEVFMRKYNRKVWTVDPSEMNSLWMGERVAVPDVHDIEDKIAAAKLGNKEEKDAKWGPNYLFRYPRYGGTGAIWAGVADRLPQGWFHYSHTVTKVESDTKVLHVHDGELNLDYRLEYDYLVTTAPLDVFMGMVSDRDPALQHMKDTAEKFVYSHTHVVGIGLRGQPPAYLANKSWLYFPDSDSPFYRVTILSNYADDMVPQAGSFWSLMCEAAEPKVNNDPEYWRENNLIEATIEALVLYGFIDRQNVVSKYHRYLDHGYPVPFLLREDFLELIQPWLEERAIFSRGRFGGWRYEVGNQDHSFMQGVEIADRLVSDIAEETYPHPGLVNSFKGCGRTLSSNCTTSFGPAYEFVVAHYNEDMSWLGRHADHCHVYDKGGNLAANLSFKQWERLPNVGREAHTYLYHIITNYDHLADVTVFTQGSISEHPSNVYNDITQYVQDARRYGFSTKYYHHIQHWGRLSHIGKWKDELDRGVMKQANTTLGEFWEIIFATPHPMHAEAAAFSAVFGVSRDRVHNHPKEFYQNIIQFLSYHSNPEEGHYMERLWGAIFT